MNTMKYVIPFLLLVCVTGRLKAQEFKVTVENTKEGEIALDEFSRRLCRSKGIAAMRSLLRPTEGISLPRNVPKG